jgi:hypothetical protein
MKAPSVFDVSSGSHSTAPSELPIMQNDRVRWNGQPVAVVVAETLEQAEYAASLVTVQYTLETPRLSFDELKASAIVPKDVIGEASEVRVGDDAERALATSAVRVDETYRTPWYNHNAIEPHATMAMWTAADRLSVFESTQCLSRCGETLADVFALDPKHVDVVAPVRRRRLRRQGRPLAAHGARGGGREADEAAGPHRPLPRAGLSSGGWPHTGGTARGARREPRRTAAVARPDLRDGHTGPHPLCRAVHVPGPSPLRDAQLVRRPDDRLARRGGEHLDARAR